jgi:hypothetical protein
MRTTSDPLPDESEMEAIVEAGRRIYDEKYKADFEVRYRGHVVAIDVATEQAFVGRSSWEASQRGRASCPDSLFYLLKVDTPNMYVRL